ncbi:hypothetical protein Btru_018725 [Bulinus truncatus]|nr:hypothetical protein Btru_018725 [Bulinus truncatus]
MTSLYDGASLSGKWIWKEDPIKPSLEFVSNNPNADKQDKRRRGRGLDGKGRGERVLSGAQRGGTFSRGRGSSNKTSSQMGTSSKKDLSDHFLVTLEDIKNVTFLERMNEVRPIPEEFNSLFRANSSISFCCSSHELFQLLFLINKLNLENKKKSHVY